MNSDLTKRLNAVKATIKQMEAKYQRTDGSVSLLAVSKTKPIEDILLAVAAGQRDFGENYLQEAVEKIQLLAMKNFAGISLAQYKKIKPNP